MHAQRECALPCPRAAEAAAGLLGELSPGARAAFEEHAAGCPRCGDALRASSAVLERLRALPQAECPDGMATRVMDRIAATPPRWLTFRLPAMPALARLAAELLLLAGLAVLQARRIAAPSPSPADAPPAPQAAAVTPDAARAGADAWLRRAQQADGRWQAGNTQGADVYDAGVTALAILALLGPAGEPLPDASRDAIDRGLAYLAGVQRDDGLFGPDCAGAPYNQGLATLALLADCTRQPVPDRREAAERGLRFIVQIQDAGGGWSYLRSPGAVNTSASIWPLIAMLHADQMGIDGLREPIERGLAWLRTNINPDGLMGYQRANEAPGGFDTLTAAGAVCLLRHGTPADRRIVRSMLPAIRQAAAAGAGPTTDLYREFFVAEALSLLEGNAGGEPGLAGVVSGRVLAAQANGGEMAGSWGARDRWGGIGGPVYATAMASLSVAR